MDIPRFLSSIHLLVDIWMVSSFLATTNKVAINIQMLFFLLSKIPKSRMAGTQGRCIFNF